MQKSKPQAGRNIRNLAFQRRVKAVVCFVLVGVIVLFPFFLLKVLQDILQNFYSLTPTQPNFFLNLPLSFYILYGSFVGITLEALELVAKGIEAWKQANLADQGAKGEEDVAQEILKLVREGWQVDFNIALGNKLGDADIVCISPQNKAYVLDVKSHSGEIVTENGSLYKRIGKTIYPFEKNLLQETMNQAYQVKNQKDLGFVTPILVFSDAKVSIPVNKLKGVYIVEKMGLVPLLKSLG